MERMVMRNRLLPPLAVVILCLTLFMTQYITQAGSVNLPNPNLDILTYNKDRFSDSNGYRAFPWGIENWSGTPKAYFDGGVPYGIVRLIGDSSDDANVLAIPNTIDKPSVTAGITYTQSFEVKLENVTGKFGVRVIHQWFNSKSYIRFKSDYGKFENGTSDWHTISLTKLAPSGAILGDPILELWGIGTVYIRNPKFYSGSEPTPTPTSTPTPTPTPQPNNTMTSEQWTQFWTWLKTQQNTTDWPDYLETMRQSWLNQSRP